MVHAMEIYLWLAILLYHCKLYATRKEKSKLFISSPTIRIALAVDSKSARDALILAGSALSTAFSPESLYFHIVTSGPDIIHAESLAVDVREQFQSCFPGIRNEVKSFLLPAERGFGSQLDRKKTVSMSGGSHWNSDSGADMLRFYLPEIFPNVSRLLYLDNDIVIGCCLEEVLTSKPHLTQRSHLSLAQIWATDIPPGKAVGVALDDLKWATTTQFQRHYNASHPLVTASIRRDGGRDPQPLNEDEFVKALPRYPNDGVLLIDVERYTQYGILANAEAIAMQNNKDGVYVVGLGTQQFTVLSMHDRWVEISPRGNLRRFPDMARGYLMWFYYNGFLHSAGHHKPRRVCQEGTDNEHQIGMYTPWAVSVLRLRMQCPNARLLTTDFLCAEHIPSVSNLTAFTSYALSIVSRFNEKESYLLRIGGFTGASSATEIEKTILTNSSWSGLVVDRKSSDGSKSYLDAILTDPTRRSRWVASVLDLCDSTGAAFNFTKMLTEGLSAQQVGCASVLDHFKSLTVQGKGKKKETLKHWQVVGLVVDSPYEKRGFDDVYTIGPLEALDLTFLRPKFILVRLESTMDITDTFHAVQGVEAILNRHGYSVGSTYGPDDSGSSPGERPGPGNTDAVTGVPGLTQLIWGVLGNSFQK